MTGALAAPAMSDQREMANSVLQQLVVTVSYGAGNTVLRAVGSSFASSSSGVETMSRGLWAPAVLGLAALAGSAVPWNQPFQSVLFMITSFALTAAMPMLASEPASPSADSLVAAGVLLYVLCIAALMCAATRAASVLGGYAQTFVGGLTSFVIAFASRASQQAFLRHGAGLQLQVLCGIYIVVASTPSREAASPGGAGGGLWGATVVRTLDALAAQGLIFTLSKAGPLAGGGSSLQVAWLYIAALLAAGMLGLDRLLPRARFCLVTFCYAIAQALLAAGQRTVGRAVIWAFATLALLVARVRQDGALAALRRVAVVGLCLCVGDEVSAQLRVGMEWREQLVVYGLLFVAVQRALDWVNTTRPSSPAGGGCACTASKHERDADAHALLHHPQHVHAQANLHQRMLVVASGTPNSE